MRKTALHSRHHALGAKMVPFGGFEMPVQYTGILDEHRAVRTSAGLFDVSHMGELEVRGKGALSFLQRMTINDVSKLTEGKAQYSALCNDTGGIIDDLLVYHCGDRYLLVVNASNTERDLAWLLSHGSPEVEIRDISANMSLLAVQGPRAEQILQKLTDVSLSQIPSYNFRRGNVGGKPAIVSRTGYTGEPGFELYLEGIADSAVDVWDALLEAGGDSGLVPVGLGARDTLRLEMGYCLYGQDIDETTSPLQAGLGWITKLDKGDFVGRPVLEQEKATGPRRKLVGLRLPDRAIARHGYGVARGGEDAGSITSGTFSPSLHASIALGYVTTAHAQAGSTVEVDIRGKSVEATIVRTPFIQKSR